MTFKETVKLHDIPVGAKKHVEVDGLETLLVNVDLDVFAIDDRCGHMNTLLSMGTLNGTVIECPLHHA